MYHGVNKEVIECQVKSDISRYFKWLDGQKLVMNVGKTNFMLFRSKRKPDLDLKIKTESYEITRVSSTKYLGVVLDEDLSWKSHIQKISSKVNPIIGAIRRSATLSKEIGLIFFNSHVMSQIRPNILIWSQGPEMNKQQIQVLLNRSMKALFKLDWYTHLKDILTEFNIFSLDEIIKIEQCKFIFKIENSLIKCNIELLRNENVHRYNTRNKNKIMLLPSKTNNMSKGLINNAIMIYNNIPKNIKNSESIEIFIKKLKLYIKSLR